MESSARVSGSSPTDPESRDGLSTQEEDLLDQSKKKPKEVAKGAANTGVHGRMEATTIGMSLERKTISYKDVCLGVNGHNTSEEDALFFEVCNNEEGTGVHQNNHETDNGFLGDPLCPVVRLTDEERIGITVPWRRSLIVKVLGRKMTLRYFQARLYKLWQPRARMEIIDLDNEYFIIRFEDLHDLQHVLDDGPWMLTDHYVVIQRWRPGFLPFQDNLQRVSVWIRVPGLPIEFYDKTVLYRIGNVLGKTVKLDTNTLCAKKDSEGEFATERGREGVPQPSTGGGQEENAVQTTAGAVTGNDTFGPWMLVQKNTRRASRENNQSKSDKSGPSLSNDRNPSKFAGKKQASGSRFSALAQEYSVSGGENVAVITTNHDQGRVMGALNNSGPLRSLENSQPTKELGKAQGNNGSAGPSRRVKGKSKDVGTAVATKKAHVSMRDNFDEGTRVPLNSEAVPSNISPRGKGAIIDSYGQLTSAGALPVASPRGKACHSILQRTGPTEALRKNMGLSLKSQVRFKTIKNVARRPGPLPSLSMPLINDSIQMSNINPLPKGPEALGSQDAVEVFNFRPPDDEVDETSDSKTEDSPLIVLSARPHTDCMEVASPEGVDFVPRSKGFTGLIKDLSLKYKVDILCLFEPRVSGPSATRVIKRLGFPSNHVVHANGFSGGLWLLWKDEVCRVDIVKDHPQFIHARVSPVDGSVPWFLTSIYASPRPAIREELWAQLQLLSTSILDPWVLMGDFNSYLSPEEKSGGAPANVRSMSRFNSFINLCGLFDLGYCGPPFTWEWRGVKERLDRGVVNAAWQVQFPNSIVHHLPPLCSDHHALLLDNTPSPLTLQPKIFRFFASWLQDMSFPNVVFNAWMEASTWAEGLHRFQKSAMEWNQNSFGD
ncbi:Endonuclease/exonuclease/phosphatase superfamily [Sesbania bispinosa]|nr:Endonuclease/exonuclease/phosphatase superfamily [Sesbania bispinosa]